MFNRLTVSSFIAATFMGTSLSADTLSFDQWRFGGGTTVNTNLVGNVLAGEFVMNNETTDTTLVAYCIDLFDFLVMADFGLLDPIDRVRNGLQGLYTNHYASVVDQATSASFQLAVWEIVYEESGGYGLGAGIFSSTTGGAVATTANAWLSDLAFETAGYDLTFWDGNASESDRASQDLVSATPVPVPAAAGLLLLALGGLGAVGRRRRAV